jgi:hypothetical protein
LDVERADGLWKSYWMGADGKRQKAQLAIPSDAAREVLTQYLYDTYHEDVTPTNGDVFEAFSASV